MNDGCPKCGSPKSGESCPRCGLIYSKYDASVVERGVPEELKTLWRSVEENWEDRGAHAHFIEKAIIFQSLGFAAACYRRHPGDRVVQAQIECINRRLEQMLAAASSSKDRPVRTGQRILTAIILIVLVAAVLALLLYLGQKGMR